MATTTNGANMAKTAPSKPMREKSNTGSEFKTKAKKLMRGGQVSQAAYDKVSGKKGKNC
jgi:hypothetical protein